MQDTAANRKKIEPIKALAIADTKKAIEYVRQHAAEYKVDPKKVGIIGFSGGGALAITLSFNDKDELRPNFAAFIYTLFKPEYNTVPINAPPVFIACATDDLFAPSSNSISLYNAWKASNIVAELHIYTKGGHGLMSAPANTWIFRFEEWLDTLGYLKLTR